MKHFLRQLFLLTVLESLVCHHFLRWLFLLTILKSLIYHEFLRQLFLIIRQKNVSFLTSSYSTTVQNHRKKYLLTFVKKHFVEAKHHGESKVIQRCFDDNKRWWQRWWQKAQRSIKEQLKWIKDQSKNNSSESRIKNQEEFKTQEESLETRIKI